MKAKNDLIFQLISSVHPVLPSIMQLAMGNPSNENIQRVLAEYEAPRHYLMGCFQDNRLVGVLGLFVNDTKLGLIKHLAILESNRHKGIGKMLIQEIIAQLSIQELTAETDEEAVNFYRKCGFTTTSFNDAKNGERYKCRLKLPSEFFEEEVHRVLPYEIRTLREEDIPLMVDAFEKANWPKPITLFQKYFIEQKNNQRAVWIAFKETNLAGYVTLKWYSDYPHFKEKNIPEIMDLNVLPQFRNLGIGSSFLDIAEKTVSQNCPVVGLGFGLYADYGSAQKLYIKRGYIPDGMGLTYHYQLVQPGTHVCLDDDLIMWVTKKLHINY